MNQAHYLAAAERALAQGALDEARMLLKKAEIYETDSPELRDFRGRMLGFETQLTTPGRALSDRLREVETRIREIARQTTVQVHQFVTTLAYGDGVGNCVRLAERVLRDWGLQSLIFAEGADERLRGEWVWFGEHQRLTAPSHLALYHPSDGRSPMIPYLGQVPDRKILYYHNITPSSFFEPWDATNAAICVSAREALRQLQPFIRAAICDSAFNASDLATLGYRQECFVVPLPLFREELTARTPDPEVLRRYRDGSLNLLFVGRIAPNKCQHELIALAAQYAKRGTQRVRLILAGATNGTAAYFDSLRALAAESAGIEVVFTGHTSPEELAAYYCVSDLFVCASAHEGFCIPLLEAMHYRLPILSRGGSAVGETLGGCSLMVEGSDADSMVVALDRLVGDVSLRTDIIHRQETRVSEFSEEHYRLRLAEALLPFLEDPAR